MPFLGRNQEGSGQELCREFQFGLKLWIPVRELRRDGKPRRLERSGV